MPLSTLHHLWIQSCMSRRAMSSKTAEHIYARCKNLVADEDAPDFADMLLQSNDMLEPFGFTMKSYNDDNTGKPWIVFCNTRSDEIAKVATEYGPQEIAYFRTLIKLIMKSGKRYAITSIDARKAGSADSVSPKLVASAAEAILETLVAKGWLINIEAKSGGRTHQMYQLSPRARAELEEYLQDEHPRQMDKAYDCKVCEDFVTKGFQCSTEGCKARMHNHCSKTYTTRHRNQGTCPTCKEPWEENRLAIVGPGARETRDEASTSEEESEGEDESRPAARKGRAAANNDDEEQQEEEEQEEETEPAPRKGSKKDARKSTAYTAASSSTRPSTARGSGVPRAAAVSGNGARSTEHDVEASDEEAKPDAEGEDEEEEDEEVDQLKEDNNEEEEDDDDDDLMSRRMAQTKKNAKAKPSKRK